MVMKSESGPNYFKKMLPLLMLLLSLHLLHGHDIKGFDDTVLFDLNWPGASGDRSNLVEPEHVILTTAYKEQYKCVLPNIQERELTVPENYDGPTPLDRLAPLFSQRSCSYRLDSYWTYEVCHGKHIRQYHEDREGKKVKVQEYILGQWEKRRFETLFDEVRTAEKEMANKNGPIPLKKVDGISLPYFEVTMGNGTECELNQNRPRETKVVYVCYIHGKHEVFSLKEISTCVYEIIVLSPLLCSHPRYKPQEIGENQINCTPIDTSPYKPRNLMKLTQEALRLRRTGDIEQIRVQFHQLDSGEKSEVSKAAESPIDTSPVESFLAGKNCLSGGTGWWKYEFCYGRSVEQYHIQNDGNRISISLGRFKRRNHLEWLITNPHKRPKPLKERTQLSHLYSDGNLCDASGKPRQTEVKLKCVENSSNPTAVALYLLEPRSCEYVLGVESPLICDILARADDNGLVVNSNDGIIEDEISTVNIVRGG